MKFIIAIEPGNDQHEWGVAVPDLPGCFSAGASLDDAIEQAKEAIDFHAQAMIEAGEAIPAPKTLAEHQADPDYSGWIWAVVEVPVERYWGPAEKLNITLPRLLLAQIDDYTRAHGLSRSGFLAQAAQTAMRA